MAEEPQKTKSIPWLALVVGLGLIVFGGTMFAWILFRQGLLDASPYVVAVVCGAYITIIPWRRARAQAKIDASGK